MAFIAEDSLYCNKKSISGDEIDNMNLKNEIGTFLSAKEDTVINPIDAPENIENLKKVSRNILDEFSIIAKQNDTHILPAPSTKETVRVYLRVKPKTHEESKYKPPPEKKTKSTLDSEEMGDADSTLLSNAAEDDSNLKSGIDEGFEVVTLESDYQVAVRAPESSATYKNSMNGNGELIHRYTFTKIFRPETKQAELFEEMVLPRVEDFLQGRNQLLFTYGATCSGKTFTIQGENENPGILPRALDVLFNSINDKLLQTPDTILNDINGGQGVFLRPTGFSGVSVCKQVDLERLESAKRAVVQLGKDLCAISNASFFSSSGMSQDSLNSHVSDCSLQSLATMFPMLKNRVKDKNVVQSALNSVESADIQYSVWISFAEIYNENIYDMLEKIPEVKRKGDKPRKIPLKLAEDKDGAVYIKGLKEIQVNSADEAYQLLMIGRENLHFAATRLNHHSSRSHCIFNIKIIKVPSNKVYKEQPHLARISMLSFCDLAGSERIKKTLNTGDRQKEAGNINTSLLVLGRAIKALRHNQSTKDPRRHQVVPYRDSKLTRLFQSYFTGRGKASMIVNISQSPYLFDESLQVLKFSAIASKVTVETFPDPEPETPQTVKKRPPKRTTEIDRLATNKTRFSILMEKKLAGKSLLDGRDSIAWENPALSSTQKIRNTLSGHGDEFGLKKINVLPVPDKNNQNNTIQEETAFITVNDGTEVPDTTVIDQRYDGLLNVIENLKEQLICEKQKNLMLERKTETLEKEVRAELCEEFNQMMVEIESGWEQRLQEEKDRASVLSEWRVNKVTEALIENRKKRRRSEEHDDLDADELETKVARIRDLEFELEEEKKQNKQQESQISAMKEVHQKIMEEQAKEREKLSRQSFEMANQQEKFKDYEDTVSRLKCELNATNEALVAQSAEPKIKELEQQLEKYKKDIAVHQKDKKELETLLEEAGDEYQSKDKELSVLKDQLVSVKNNSTQNELRISDLETEIQECRALLDEANSRVEEKEFLIEEKDAQISVLEERGIELEGKIQNLRSEHEQQENDRWLTKKANDQQLSELNDEVERLKEEKKKLKQQFENEQTLHLGTKSELDKQEQDILKLQNEIKSLIQAEKQQRDAKDQLEEEECTLRKSIKNLTQKLSDTDTLKKKLNENEAKLEETLIELEAARKESSVTEVLKAGIESLRSDKEEKAKETASLLFKIENLQADVKNAEYDVQRLKDDKHNLMDHYEKQLKKKDSEMATLRKRFDPNRTVEILNNATPNKKIEQNEHEISTLKDVVEAKTKELQCTVSSYKELIEGKDIELNTLRQELIDKSELVKNLAAQINSPILRKDNLKEENAELVKELDRVNAEHRILMSKQASASNMLIKEFKQQNILLQNAVSASNREVGMSKNGDEEDKTFNLVKSVSNSTVEDLSTLESPSVALTPENGKKKKNKRGRSRKINKNLNTFSPVLCESQNSTHSNSHSDLREKISSIRKASICESKSDVEENENIDPSLLASSVRSHDDSMSSSSSFLGDQQRKIPTKRGRTSKRKRNVERSENNPHDGDKTEQRRSLRRSIRDRAGPKTMMPPPTNTKIENSFLSPLIENEGAITVTTTTTLSPQKTRVSFMTPQNKRKKLFNNESANEVFTPPETVIDKTSPHTIVRWQLRSRRSRRNN